MSAENEGTEAPKKRRGRPPGRTKRHDSVEAPVDGDYAFDKLTNRDPAKRYAWLHPDDVAERKSMGWRKVARTPDGVRPAFDLGEEGDTGYQFKQLALYEAPEERARLLEQRALSMEQNRRETILRDVRAQGLSIDENRSSTRM